MREYKYSTRFQAFARAVNINETSKKLATASLKELANVFSSRISKKIDDNPDLLFIASNLIICDHINLNGDAVSKQDLLAVYEKFKLKPLDLQHDRELVRGAIYDVGFSIYPTNKMISAEEAAKSDEPIQLVVGGYLWKLVDPDLCRFLVEASDEKSEKFGLISTSFELLFDSYDICIGTNGNTDINDAKIIKPGEPLYEKYNSLLKQNGGSGIEGDNIIGRILRDDILPAGAGLVTKPASGLKGILTLTTSKSEKEGEKLEEDDKNELQESNKEWLKNAPQSGVGQHICDIEMKDGTTYKSVAILNCSTIPNCINAKNIKSIKLSEKDIKAEISCVNDNIKQINQIDKIMPKIKDLIELEAQWNELRKLETSASVREFIEGELTKLSSDFAVENKKKEELLKTVEANKATAESKVKELESTVNTLNEHVSKMKAEESARKQQEKFNERMNTVDATFALEPHERSMLADDVKKMPHEECGDADFGAWLDKHKVLMKEKTHDHINKVKSEAAAALESKKSAEANVKETSVKEVVKEALASVKETPNQEVPNSVVPSKTETLTEQYKRVFGETLTIGDVKSKDLIKKD